MKYDSPRARRHRTLPRDPSIPLAIPSSPPSSRRSPASSARCCPEPPASASTGQFGALLQPCWEEEVTERPSVSKDLLWHAVPTAARSSTCQLGRRDNTERRRPAEHRRQRSNVGSNLNSCLHHHPVLHSSLDMMNLECSGFPLTTAMDSSTRPFP